MGVKIRSNRTISGGIRQRQRRVPSWKVVGSRRIETERAQRIFERQEWQLACGFFFAHPEQVARNRPSI